MSAATAEAAPERRMGWIDGFVLSLKELLIALGLLGSSVLLYAYRRKVQDGERLTLRDPTPTPTVAQ